MNAKLPFANPADSPLATSVQRIVASSLFQSSPTLSRLLRYLGAATDPTGTQRIKAYSIALEVFNQPANFDPQTNALVRVMASRLRDLLRRYYVAEGAADPWRVSIPSGGYAVQLLPASAVSAGATLDSTAIFGPKVAVLPFINLSGDEQNYYICDGITQEIMHLLTQSRELQLLGPDTMFHYRDRATEPVGVGRELGVDYILSGNIRLGGEHLRITAQLTDVHANRQVWTQSYERTLTPASILAVQDDIALHIVAILCSPHGVIDRLARRRPASDFSAYAAVLRFYEYLERYTPETHATACTTLELAVEIVPTYAEAWACLAGTYCSEHIFGFNPRSGPVSALDRALAAAQRAVQLAPDCIIGLYGLAQTHFYRREMPQFRDVTEHALALAPHRTDLLASLGLHLAYDGQWQRGLAMLDRARALNPLHPTWYWFPYALDAYRRGDYAVALLYAGRLNMPEFYWDPLFIAMICGQLGQQDKARDALAHMLALRPDLTTDAAAIIGILMPDAGLVAQCVEGLRKAGL